ncbi:uncharacterized protein LOC141573520 [Camelus bactrianus]|uniref:Uncharacterized protein LOC141573520 n=1 Tax=Camelus bactrianus TaxID=9837 RepID=A0AC58NJL7_CAMBA
MRIPREPPHPEAFLGSFCGWGPSQAGGFNSLPPRLSCSATQNLPLLWVDKACSRQVRTVCVVPAGQREGSAWRGSYSGKEARPARPALCVRDCRRRTSLSWLTLGPASPSGTGAQALSSKTRLSHLYPGPPPAPTLSPFPTPRPPPSPLLPFLPLPTLSVSSVAVLPCILRRADVFCHRFSKGAFCCEVALLEACPPWPTHPEPTHRPPLDQQSQEGGSGSALPPGQGQWRSRLSPQSPAGGPAHSWCSAASRAGGLHQQVPTPQTKCPGKRWFLVGCPAAGKTTLTRFGSQPEAWSAGSLAPKFLLGREYGSSDRQWAPSTPLPCGGRRVEGTGCQALTLDVQLFCSFQRPIQASLTEFQANYTSFLQP